MTANNGRRHSCIQTTELHRGNHCPYHTLSLLVKIPSLMGLPPICHLLPPIFHLQSYLRIPQGQPASEEQQEGSKQQLHRMSATTERDEDLLLHGVLADEKVTDCTEPMGIGKARHRKTWQTADPGGLVWYIIYVCMYVGR